MDSVCELLDWHKEPYIRIDGSTKAEHRPELVSRFQSRAPGAPRIAVLQMIAACESLTLTKANLVWFLEFHANYNILLQCEDRSHRLTQTKPVTCQYLFAQDTTDIRFWRMLQHNVKNATLIMDGKIRPLHALYCSAEPDANQQNDNADSSGIPSVTERRNSNRVEKEPEYIRF
jgi:SNF2 family DNA or RNA helicase